MAVRSASELAMSWRWMFAVLFAAFFLAKARAVARSSGEADVMNSSASQVWLFRASMTVFCSFSTLREKVVAVSAARSLRCCAHSSFSVTPEGTVLKSMVAMSGSCLSCHNRERPKARNQRGSSHYQGAGAKYPHCQ